MGYDSTSYLPKAVPREKAESLLLMLGYQISAEFTDEVAFKALEDLEEAVTRVYRMVTSTFKWHFIKDWGSGTKRIRKQAAAK